MQPERSVLAAGAAALGIDASEAQIDVLLGYLRRLEKWNRVYNLTAVRETTQMVSHHLLDSMTIVAPLRRTVAGIGSVLDVGSGAGFPGAVVAALMPEVEVTCVDAVGKKMAFVRQAAAELGLSRLHALHARVESLHDAVPDVIVSRAFASLARFVAATRHLMIGRGCWLAMKGVRPVAELDDLPSDIEVFHVEQTKVPDLKAERHLVWMRMRSSSAGCRTPAEPAHCRTQEQ
jgi:16S rRNA (guanine527-N7)-methyltransferase